METTRIDLSQEQKSSGQDLSGLKSHLAPLLGVPFRFARVSYGDELTLHFGDLRPAVPRSSRTNRMGRIFWA